MQYQNSDLHNEVVMFRKLGQTYGEISSHCGIDTRYVANIINKYAPELNNSAWEQRRNQKLDLPLDQIVALRKFGWSKDQISQCFGCSTATIKNRWDEHYATTKESLGGYIKPTLRYPTDGMATLHSIGKTVWQIAKESNATVMAVVLELVSREPSGRKPRQPRKPRQRRSQN